ncbi:integrin alpha [Streptomyces sp. NPDC059604]|uniref:integrin alpha n=1 Tax=Streptomyces sp. NPDC059604 TaxID=3346881 RepID=UPI0036936E1C
MPVLSPRRRLAIATGVALVAGALAAPVGHAAAQSSAPAAQPSVAAASTPSTERLRDDFNGDGYPDVAVGAPMATTVVGSEEGAGAVSVLFGGPGGLSSARKQVLTWPNRSGIEGGSDARYGTELHSADLNADGYADLVSRLWANIPGDQGTVLSVNWGGASGLSKNATVLAPVPGDQTDATGDLDVGDVDGDGFADIAVGDVRRGGHVLHGPIGSTGKSSRISSFSVDGTAVLDTSEIAVGDVTGDGVGDLVMRGVAEGGPGGPPTVPR